MSYPGVNGNPARVRESIFAAVQTSRQGSDPATRLAVTRQALDEVSLGGSATEQQIAESTLDAVAGCRIRPESAAKAYETALYTLLLNIPPSAGLGSVLAYVARHSMAQVDPSDGLRIGEQFLNEVGSRGGRAERAVAQAGLAISNTLAPDAAVEVLGSTLTTLIHADQAGQPGRLVGTPRDGMQQLRTQVNQDLRFVNDWTVSKDEVARVDGQLSRMLESGNPVVQDDGFFIAP